MVDEFVENTQNTNKIQHLPSSYGKFWSLVVCENLIPKKKPLLSSLMKQASFKCETTRLELESSALSYISSYQTLSADKNWKSNKASMELVEKIGADLRPSE
jgi:hypothetical protein